MPSATGLKTPQLHTDGLKRGRTLKLYATEHRAREQRELRNNCAKRNGAEDPSATQSERA